MARPDGGLSKARHFRLTEAEDVAFLETAKRLKASRADLLRRAVREIIRQPADLLDKELAALDEAVYQVKAVGRNLNQIVRAIHLGTLTGKQVDRVTVEAVSQAVARLDARLTEVIEKSRLRRVFR